MEQTLIQNPQSRGGAKLILISAVALAMIILIIVWQQQLALAHALALIVAALGLFTGWAKLAEPQVVLKLDVDGVQYFHRKGSWHLPWRSFIYSGLPQFDDKNLAYIGFKVTNYDMFLQGLSLRLAVRIMAEQRDVYLAAVRQNCESGQCGSEILADTEPFSTTAERYNGIKAAFGRRMVQLSKSTGFDLLVPVSFSESETQILCRKINDARLQLIQNTAT